MMCSKTMTDFFKFFWSARKLCLLGFPLGPLLPMMYEQINIYLMVFQESALCPKILNYTHDHLSSL